MRDWRRLTAMLGAVIALRIVIAGASADHSAPAGRRLLQANLAPVGAFKLPHDTLGTTYGFGSYAGCCGIGAYGVAFNPEHNSLFIGGHPYEQRLAEIAIPASFSGSPIATALTNLIDPVEGKLGEINPGDPNQKVLSSALVYNGKLYVGAFAYYDGSSSQKKSWFVRPTSLTTSGQVVGPVQVGSLYAGWVDKFASLIPAEWQAAFGGPAFAGGAGGNINAAQSWGPAISVFDPAKIGSVNPVPGTLVLGYPMAHPLADTSVGNTLWSQTDYLTAVVAIPGTNSVLFFGKHGMGAYCYGPGTSSQSQAGQPADGGVDRYCYDPAAGAKGSHAFPYRSQVWAYDMNDLVAVKKGQKNSYDVKPYATWELDASFTEIQGAAYDPATRRLFVSEVGGDSHNNQPLIHVYTVQ